MSYLGVNYPAYGEFKCLDCGRRWYSSKAWRDFGQKCKTCDITVSALSLLPLGRYNCFDCERSWKTKYDENGCHCSECGKKIKPKLANNRNPFIKPKILKTESERNECKIDSKISHKEDLCEKCIFYRKPCIGVSENEMERKPFVPQTTQIYNKAVKQFSPSKEFQNSVFSSAKHYYGSGRKNKNPIPSLNDIIAEEEEIASKSDNFHIRQTKIIKRSKFRANKKSNERIETEIQNSLTYFAKSNKAENSEPHFDHSKQRKYRFNYNQNNRGFEDNFKSTHKTTAQPIQYSIRKERPEINSNCDSKTHSLMNTSNKKSINSKTDTLSGYVTRNEGQGFSQSNGNKKGLTNNTRTANKLSTGNQMAFKNKTATDNTQKRTKPSLCGCVII